MDRRRFSTWVNKFEWEVLQKYWLIHILGNEILLMKRCIEFLEMTPKKSIVFQDNVYLKK